MPSPRSSAATRAASTKSSAREGGGGNHDDQEQKEEEEERRRRRRRVLRACDKLWVRGHIYDMACEEQAIAHSSLQHRHDTRAIFTTQPVPRHLYYMVGTA